MPVFVGVGVGGRRKKVDTPPPPTSGQTRVWIADGSGRNNTYNSGSPANYTSLSGTMYGRGSGPRYGTAPGDATYAKPGGAFGVQFGQFIGDPATVMEGYYDLTADAVPVGAMGGWFFISQAPTSYVRTLMSRGYSLDLTAPLSAVVVKKNSTGSQDLTIKNWDSKTGGDGTNGTPFAGKLNEWYWFQIGWEYNGTSTVAKSLYKRLGDTSLTLLGTRTDATAISIAPRRSFVRAIKNDLAGVTPWSGCYGAHGVWRCATFAAAQLYPNEIREPSLTPITYFVNSSGNDANDGLTAATAWQSGTKVMTERLRETFRPRRYDRAVSDNAGAFIDCSTYTIPQLLAEADQAEAGNRRWTGDIVRFTGRVETTRSLGFENLNGHQFELTAGATLTNQHDLTGATYSSVSGIVWKLTDTVYGDGQNGGMLYENGVPLVPVYAANEAAATVLIQGGAGRIWCGTTGIIFSTLGGTNPNTDGIARTACRPLLQFQTTNAVISGGVGRVYGTGTVQSGISYVYTGGSGAAPNPAYCLGQARGGHFQAEGVILDQGCYHSDGGIEAGPSKSQLFTRLNVKVRACSTAGGGIPHVTYTSADAGNSDANTRAVATFFGCQLRAADAWQNVGQPVGTPSGGNGIYSHSNGSFLGNFGLRIRSSNHDGGYPNPSYALANSFSIENSTVQGVQTDRPGCTVDSTSRITGGFLRPYPGGSIAMTGGAIDCSAAAANQWNGDVPVDGPVSINGTTVDLSNAAGGRVTTVFASSGAAGTVSVTNCPSITLNGRYLFKVTLAAHYTASNNVYHGTAGDFLGTIAGVPQTLAMLQALGKEVGSTIGP